MNLIRETFENLKDSRRKALIPFFTAGYPSLAASYDFARIALENGADIFEIGAPFSDPIADGPAIQYSSQKSLESGTRLQDILKMASKLKKDYSQPLILMGYYNPLIAFGLDNYLRMAADHGVDGLIIPDLPVEEGEAFRSACDGRRISTIFLVAPTSNRDRIGRVERLSSGFVYAVSIAGITGARGNFGDKTIKYFALLKRTLSQPFVIGFGISSPSMAQAACRYADGAVIGSAFVEIYRRAKTIRAARNEAERFIKRIRKAI